MGGLGKINDDESRQSPLHNCMGWASIECQQSKKCIWPIHCVLAMEPHLFNTVSWYLSQSLVLPYALIGHDE